MEFFLDGTPISDWFYDYNIPSVELLGKKYKITDYEIKDDGKIYTAQLQNLIDIVSNNGGGVLVVPKGTYKTGALYFKQGVNLYLEKDAVLMGSDDICHYQVIETRIEGALKKGRKSCITDYLEEGKSITSSMIRKSIEREDELVTQCVTEASEYLSGGLASVINLINPKLIVLGGGLIEAVDYFYQKTIKEARAKSLPVLVEKIEFKKTVLGDYSGVIGAVFLDERGDVL